MSELSRPRTFGATYSYSFNFDFYVSTIITGIHYVGGMGTSDTDTIKSLKNVLDTITPIDDPVVWDKMKGKTLRL